MSYIYDIIMIISSFPCFRCLLIISALPEKPPSSMANSAAFLGDQALQIWCRRLKVFQGLCVELCLFGDTSTRHRAKSSTNAATATTSGRRAWLGVVTSGYQCSCPEACSAKWRRESDEAGHTKAPTCPFSLPVHEQGQVVQVFIRTTLCRRK